MRVKLIVSGDLERTALHHSLQRHFQRTGSGEEVEFLRPTKEQGPTSNPLPALSGDPPQLVRKFCKAMIAETLFGSEVRQAPPDLVIGIDDLELDNLAQPELVTGWIRRGVEAYLSANPENKRTDERRREALRTRCAFHLLAPMPEAYFFGERAALERAGVSTTVHARLDTRDLEDFRVGDPEYEPREGRPDDLQHPKRYLKHLLHRSGRPLARPYRETRDGKAALATLAWPSLSSEPRALGFARALFEDIADVLGVPSPLGEGHSASLTYPNDHRNLILRNL